MTTETDPTIDDAAAVEADDPVRARRASKGATAPRSGAIAPRRASDPVSKARAAAQPPATRPRGGRGPAALPWALAVLGLIGTVAFGALWLAGRGGGSDAPSGATEDVLAAAEAFSLALTNFDGATIDGDVDGIVALSTGDFRDEVDQFFGSATRQQLKEAAASSRGEVRSAFVQSVEGDRATAFVVLDQTIANNRSPQPKADTLRMEVALEEVGGTWLVQRVNVLEAPADAYQAPSSTAGATPSTTVQGGSDSGQPGG